MHYVILWVLILTGPRPYELGRFATHGDCVQARYDYERGSSSTKEPRPVLLCTQQRVYTYPSQLASHDYAH